jgi:CheY-like chemotaxis protein
VVDCDELNTEVIDKLDSINVDVPVIALESLFGKKNSRSKAFKFSGALSTPIKPSELMDKIASPQKLKTANKNRHKKRLDQSIEYDDYRVLVAEDDDVNRAVTSLLLKAVGFTVDSALNGQDALELARSRKYDLIIMDIEMPILDGYQTARKLRNDPNSGGHDVPVIAMTANSHSGIEKQFREAGMNDFIIKPIDASDLYRKISHWLGNEKHELPFE